jgi:dsDNA-specific endonuclease/ATPase MutS2
MIDVLGDVANGSVENFNALTSVLTRVSTSGKVNEMTLRQLAQAGFGVQDMAQALGKSEKSLLADIKAGKVGYNELTRAMQNATAEGGRFYQNAQKQARTLGGSIKILKDTISSMGDAIGTNDIRPLTDMLHHLIKIAKAFSGSVVNAGTKAFEAIMAIGSRVLRFFEILGFRIEDLGLSFEPLIGVVHSFY